MSSTLVSSSKKLLLDELNSENINILNVRNICKNNPNLLITEDDINNNNNNLRIQIWILLLLGQNYNYKNKKLVNTSLLCKEYSVLIADINRTKQNLNIFKTELYKSSLLIILNNFCINNNIEYKQGMNEVCAIFMYLIVPNNDECIILIYDLFSSFMFRYMERFCCLNNIVYLKKSFQLFQLLLNYHDPLIGYYFTDLTITPDLYATEWFMTLFSRSIINIDLIIYLYDNFIYLNDPIYVYFLGYSLFQLDYNNEKNRNNLMKYDYNELLINLNVKEQCKLITNVNDIDKWIKISLNTYDLTPRCFCRCLRLSCVASATTSCEINTFNNNTNKNNNGGISIDVNNNNNNNNNNTDNNKYQRIFDKTYLLQQDEIMSKQSYLDFITMSSSELMNYILESSSNINNNIEDNISSILNVQQHVIIDIRTNDEIIDSNNLMIPKAIQLNPEYLQFLDNNNNNNNHDIFINNNPITSLLDDDENELQIQSNNNNNNTNNFTNLNKKYDNSLFYKWIQLYDGMKDCHICIVDMPRNIASSTLLLNSFENYANNVVQITSNLPNKLNIITNETVTDVVSKVGEGISVLTDYWISSKDNNILNNNNSNNQNNNDLFSSSYWTSLGNQISSIVAPINNNNNNNILDNMKIKYTSEYIKNNVLYSKLFSKVSILLVKELQKHGFKYVSILDGGIPSLLQQCYTRKGIIEPVFINFDYNKWELYLKSQNLLNYSLSLNNNNNNKSNSPKRLNKLFSNNFNYNNIVIDNNNDSNNINNTKTDSFHITEIPSVIRYSNQLTQMERIRMGLEYAKKHNHKYMVNQLSVKLKKLEDLEYDSLNIYH